MGTSETLAPAIDLYTCIYILLYIYWVRMLLPIRPNRKFERNQGKYRARIKPKITKNQKNAV